MLHKVSLSGIRVFEAVARLGSHKAAAAELNLSPSAISHALRNLEEVMGVQLFEREGRGFRLSISGDLFMRHVTTAFDELRRGLDVVATGRARHVLRIHAAPSIAYAILAPRLPRFLSAHPGVEARLSASTDYARFTTNDFDADIVYGPIHAVGVAAVPLGVERVMPLCAPGMAGRIRTPRDLLGCNLIVSDNKQVRWPHWFHANGVAAAIHHNLSFDRSFLALGAAADGLGVALESTLLADRELASGRLVAPLAGKSVDVTYTGHHLVYPRDSRRATLLATFRDWLVSELATVGQGAFTTAPDVVQAPSASGGDCPSEA